MCGRSTATVVQRGEQPDLEVRRLIRFLWAWELWAAGIVEVYGNKVTTGNVLPNFVERLRLANTV